MGKVHYKTNNYSIAKNYCRPDRAFYAKKQAIRDIDKIPSNLTKFAESIVRPDLSGGEPSMAKTAFALLGALTLVSSIAGSVAAESNEKSTGKEPYTTKASHWDPNLMKAPNKSCLGAEDIQLKVEPYFHFSANENNFPVSPLYDDTDVSNNNEKYATNPSIFGKNVNVASYKDWVVGDNPEDDGWIKVWKLYYANNPMPGDVHEHDLEYLIVYKSYDAQKAALSHHLGFKYYDSLPLKANFMVNGGDPDKLLEVFVEKNGHAMALYQDEFKWPSPGVENGGSVVYMERYINPTGYTGTGPMEDENCTDSLGRYKSGPADHAFGDLATGGDEALFKLIGAVSQEKENFARERAKVPSQQYYLNAPLKVFSDKYALQTREFYSKISFSGDLKFRVEDASLGKYTGEKSPPVQQIPLSYFESKGDMKGVGMPLISDFKNLRCIIDAESDGRYSITTEAIIGSSIHTLESSGISISKGQSHIVTAGDFSKSDKPEVGVDTNRDGTVDYVYGGMNIQTLWPYIAIGTGAALGVAYLFYRKKRKGKKKPANRQA